MPTNSSGARGRLEVGDASYEVLRLDRVDGSTRLLYSLKVLLENLLRCEDGTLVAAKQVAALASWAPAAESGTAIGFTPPGCSCMTSLGAVRGRPGRDARRDGRSWR
jgi:aconitate hydratase